MKNLLITGASKNLGKYLSEFFLQKDFNVIGVSKKSLPLKNKSNSYICDLSNYEKTLKLFKNLKKKYNKIDYVISCAGYSKKTYKNIPSKKDWDISLNNNFFSNVNLINCYDKFFLRNNSKLLIISSIVTKKITKAPVTYSVSKAALNYYVSIKSKELSEKKAMLNLLLPGNILMKGNNWSKKLKKNKTLTNSYIKKNVPLGRFISPIEIALYIEYYFNAEIKNLTGSEFVIDGGEVL